MKRTQFSLIAVLDPQHLLDARQGEWRLIEVYSRFLVCSYIGPMRLVSIGDDVSIGSRVVLRDEYIPVHDDFAKEHQYLGV